MQFNTLFANVTVKVAVASLKLKHQRYKMCISVTTPCSKQFQSSVRVPCEHSSYADGDWCFQLENFHPHWWLIETGAVIPQKIATLASYESHLQEAYDYEESPNKRMLLFNCLVSLISLSTVDTCFWWAWTRFGNVSDRQVRRSGFYRHLRTFDNTVGNESRKCVVSVITLDACPHRCPATNVNTTDARPFMLLPKAEE